MVGINLKDHAGEVITVTVMDLDDYVVNSRVVNFTPVEEVNDLSTFRNTVHDLIVNVFFNDHPNSVRLLFSAVINRIVLHCSSNEIMVIHSVVDNEITKQNFKKQISISRELNNVNYVVPIRINK